LALNELKLKKSSEERADKASGFDSVRFALIQISQFPSCVQKKNHVKKPTPGFKWQDFKICQ